MWEGIARDATTLFVVIDPIGNIPLFLALTRSMPVAMRNKIALRAVVIAAIILLMFILGGRFLLQKLEISMPSFQIAGGFVLFLFGLQMIFETEPKREPHSMELQQDVAVFPLAIPAIAGPGTMTVLMLLTDYERQQGKLVDPIRTSLMLLLILFVTYLCLRLAGAIQRVIGDTGANVISRLMGLILAALAVETVLQGIRTFWNQGAV